MGNGCDRGAWARVEHRILILEPAARLDLVVAEAGAERTASAEPGDQVPPLLEDQHLVSGARQLPGRDAATGARADDDHRWLGHLASHPPSREPRRFARRGSSTEDAQEAPECPR